MWELEDYEHHGESFTVPTPHNILPKPYGKGHPPIWVACGNPPTFKTAGEMGIGAIAFNFEPIFALRGRIEAYKEGIANCTEPIGQFKNDNVMITNSVICCETREEARKIALREGRGYLVSMVNLYHDTMPKSTDGITWPDKPLSLHDMASQPGVDADELLDGLIQGGYMLVGNPDDICEQITAWGDVGMDQLSFGLPIEGLHHEEILARRVRLLGVRGRLADGAAPILELQGCGRRRHHPRYAVPLALRARQSVRQGGQAVSCLGATHIPSRVDEQGKEYERRRRRRGLCDVPARRRGHRAHQLVMGDARSPRRSGDVPGRWDAWFGGGRPDEMLDAAPRQHAQARLESRPAADDRLLQHLGRGARQHRLRQRLQAAVGNVPAPRREDAPWKYTSGRRRKGRATCRTRVAKAGKRVAGRTCRRWRSERNADDRAARPPTDGRSESYSTRRAAGFRRTQRTRLHTASPIPRPTSWPIRWQTTIRG